ncbi:MAG: DEAD/DEAH box helicase [Proteobacteria bacterium]|nr:DEAD/DEAH box helicase [Pseudomonadota bacterium]
MSDAAQMTFADFGLRQEVLAAVNDVGYETPTPIQIPTIPHLLAGRDVVGQAQTGTGKTAAFALPLLSRLDLKLMEPQVLVLTPTRELAIQVAEAFQSYASHLRGFHVLPVYGGQDYAVQLRQLKRGVHVIVGTPGRLMDHMRRGTLKLSGLKTVVLDEADEMLRMGFIEDVEWILGQTPPDRQVALFSATMPAAIRRIAQQHLRDPAEITIKLRTTTAETIHQRYWIVTGVHKLDALTRLLETEPFDAVLVFVRTRIAAVELADRLQARGYATSALNGDMPQKQREQTIARLKASKLDILVATDVAARGLDVERISHVVNFDIPNDTEAYVHRIGRTGRAGRSGEAILFVAPRERHLLRAIEKATRQQIEPMELPSADVVNDKRIAKFTQRITDTLATRDLAFFRDIIVRYQQQHDADPIDIAAALAQLAQGDKPLLVKDVITLDKRPRDTEGRDADSRTPGSRETSRPDKSRKGPRAPTLSIPAGTAKELYRVEVGRTNGVQPGNLVGAIANEAGVASSNIGRIEIFDAYSTIELPEGMPKDIFHLLKKVWVSGRQLEITKVSGAASVSVAPRTRPTKKYDSAKKHGDAAQKPKKPKKLKLVAPNKDA